MRLRTKSMSILLKIPNGPGKMSAKTPSEWVGEDGIDSDIEIMASGSKKVETIRAVSANFDFSRNPSFKARL